MSTAGWFSQNAPPGAGALPPSTPAAGSAAPPSAASTSPNWFAQNAPSTKSAQAPAAQSNGPEAIAANPRSEGIYQMQSPDGRPVQIPYSKIKTAGPAGYRFQNQNELARYAKDHAADPIDESAVDRYMDNTPWWDMPGHALNLIAGVGTGATKTAAGLDRAVRGNGPLTGPEEQLQLAAATPTKGGMQAAGELGENVGEFFSGEELLGLIGRGLQGAEKLKAATQVSQVLENHPMIAKLVKIGQNAVRQGAIGGAQTYAKTGGDTGAALAAGAETAGAGALIEGAGAAAGAGVKAATTPAAAAPGAAEYAEQARGVLRPHLEAVNDAIAGGKPKPRAIVAAADALKPPAINIDQVLNQVHDFTGAADRLTDVNTAAYGALDKLTDGKFSQVNSEVKAAQRAAFHGGPDEAKAYQAAQQKMDDLLGSTKGVSKDTVQALKQSWRASYQLRDVANLWDRALDGVPGATKVSGEQRGVKGGVLMTGLRKAVERNGRSALEATLGPGRLENLENIARLNQTNTQRSVFNHGISEVARYLGPTYIGERIGEHVAGGAGAIAGAALGAAAKPTIERVMNAVKANPKIGNYLTYAIESGADPKHFGPLLATMIQQSNTEASRQQREQEGENQ